MLHDFTLNLWSGNADQISVNTYLTGSPPPPDAAALGCVDPPEQADAVVKPRRGPLCSCLAPSGPGPGLAPLSTADPKTNASWKTQRTIYFEMCSFMQFS